MKKSASLILGICLLLSSCIESGGSDSGTDFIPDVEAACGSAQVPGAQCSGSGSPVRIGLTSDTGEDCRNLLINLMGQPLYTRFEASGSATATQVGYLSATVTAWVNDLGGIVDVLAKRSFKACAFVDANSNGQLDSNEAWGQGFITPGVQPATVSDWDIY